MPYSSEHAYRRATVQSASPIELVITLYDILVKDLRQLEEHIVSRNYQAQTTAIKHALLALQQLEGSLDENGGALVDSLVQFYSMLRRTLLQAQAEQSVSIIHRLIAQILQVRGAFEIKQRQCQAAVSVVVASFPRTQEEQARRGWNG